MCTLRRIKYLCSQGLSIREVAKITGVHHTTVTRNYKRKQAPEPEKRRVGRPCKLDKRIVTHLSRLFDHGMLSCATSAADEIRISSGICVHKTTVARTMRKNGFVSASKPKKPRLTAWHKMNRLNFAKAMKSFPIDAWKNVIFTDESKISIHGPDGNNRVWRRRGGLLLDHHVIPTVKFGGKSVMVWGAISYQGVGKLIFIETKMDAELYVDILKSGYVGTVEMHNMDPGLAVLQQDNDPKHTAKYTKEWFSENGIRVFKWPSCSPDMNIIEHVWFYLKVRISRFEPKPKNIDELKHAISEIWRNIPESYIKSLYDSIPGRILELERVKGSYTRY